MVFDSDLLSQFWLAVVAHLWQTTLVLLPLFLLARVMRNAPARMVNALWTIGLLKVFLPLALLLPVGRRTIVPLLERLMPFAFGGGAASVWLGRASAVLDPAVLAVSGHSNDHSLAAGLLGFLTIAWVGCVVYLAVRWVRLGRLAGSPGAMPLQASCKDLHGRVGSALSGTGIPQDAIRIAQGSAMPAVVGLFRPRIVISEVMAAELTAGELRAVLLHENEHRRRYDPLRSAIQQTVLAIFFYYPLLWALLRRLASTCEIACDEAAIGRGISPAAYARALARTVSIGLLPSYLPAGIGTSKPSLLNQRLSRLRENRRYTTMMKHRIALAAAILLVLAVSLIPLPPLAGTDGEGDQVLDPSPVSPKPPAVGEVPLVPAPPAEPAYEAVIEPPKLVPESYVLPVYPEAARKAGIEGEVILDVTVNANGSVGAVSVREGIPECPALDESAQEAVREWKFEPATKDGKPIEMTVGVPLRFRLDEEEKPLKADTMPELIQESILKPEYPEDARKAGISGTVILDVMVKQDGTAGEISVREGVADYPSLAEKAVEAVREWKFKPATKDGKPISMSVAIPVAFRLDDAKGDGSKSAVEPGE
jgi:TonB family protein